jgi:hypothetical protein
MIVKKEKYLYSIIYKLYNTSLSGGQLGQVAPSCGECPSGAS